ncbi:MAG: hypothetical protein ACT4PT_13355 [Methanobacteriota archaeon]
MVAIVVAPTFGALLLLAAFGLAVVFVVSGLRVEVHRRRPSEPED